MDRVRILSQLADLLGQVVENEPLKNHTTLKIGGPARYYHQAQSSDGLIRAVELAKELGLNYVILGGGSNILVSDSGFDGLVIHAKNKNLRLQGDKLYVEAGVPNNEAVKESVNAGLTGLEWLASVPGTIGGAIHGNAGCFSYSIKDAINKVDIYRDGAKKRLSKKECLFAYRESIFKRNNDIILSAELVLKPGNKEESKKKIKEMAQKKMQTQPLDQLSAGSVFKNFKIRNEQDLEPLKRKTKIPDEFLQDRVIPAGWLVEQAGAKGMEMGGIKVSDKHANFFINDGSGKAEQFIMLISRVKMAVRDELGIQLDEEIQLIGF